MRDTKVDVKPVSTKAAAHFQFTFDDRNKSVAHPAPVRHPFDSKQSAHEFKLEGPVTGLKFPVLGGRTVSHSINPGPRRVNDLAQEPEDSRFKAQLAKQAFMQMDEKTLQAFRNKGKTPVGKEATNSQRQDLIKGELSAGAIKPHSITPLSFSNQSSSLLGSTKPGYLGTLQDVSSPHTGCATFDLLVEL